MAELDNNSNYESVRNARISENKAKLESMGLLRRATELRSIISSSSTANKRNSKVTKKPWNGIRLEGPPRRSERLKNISAPSICCHFCRKKLCREDSCKRCVDRDAKKPCIGKTECSFCHSSNGVFCGRCLKTRYGEELEEVRANMEWMCPHCVEKKGLKPYWICNSSLCLKKRRGAPSGISGHHARQLGYESVAHLIMDKLKHKNG